MFFLCEYSYAQRGTMQKKKLFTFPVTITACKPLSKTDTLQIEIKVKEMTSAIPSFVLNDLKSTAIFNETIHYNETNQLTQITTDITNKKEATTAPAESVYSGLPAGSKSGLMDMFHTIIDSMTFREPGNFEFTYNDTGQLSQIIIPKFPVPNVNNTLSIDDSDTIKISYNNSGRIIRIIRHSTLTIVYGETIKKGYAYKTVNVDYNSDTSFRCTAVSIEEGSSKSEKGTIDFNFNRKGNLIKAIQRKEDSSGVLQLVNETIYSYYEDITNPGYYGLNRNFSLAFTSDNPMVYSDMSVNFLRKAIQRNADSSVETQTVDSFYLDANRNVIRYISQRESKFINNRIFKNYIYSKNCGTIFKSTSPKKDVANSILPGFKDIDGNVYHSVKIGNQIWMTEDLRVTHFRNGDSIPEVADASLWKYLQRSAHNKNNNKNYLYNWHTINDPRNIAPVGWHVSTEAEWNTLIKNLGGASIAGDALKDASEWTDSKINTTKSGFAALPMGKINSDLGLYQLVGKEGYYWIKSLTQTTDPNAASFNIKSSNHSTLLQKTKKTDGLSVRCVKD